MKKLSLAIIKIKDNIEEIKDRTYFLEAIKDKSSLVIQKNITHTSPIFTLTKAELEMLKQFSLARIKLLRKATFVDNEDIEARND